MTLVLSIFPGIDLLGRGFEEEGFCVVRGPDLLWGGDVKAFHPPAGRFAGVIGGPPCQAFSMMRWIWKNRPLRAAQNLIPEFERIVLEAQPHWYLMENVVNAPIPSLLGYWQQLFKLDCRKAFGVPQKRRRRLFLWGCKEARELHLPPPEYVPSLAECEFTAMASEGGHGARRWVHDGPGGRTRIFYIRQTPWDRFCVSQGLPPDFDLPGMTVEGKYRAVGNGVPLQAARAFARAIREAMNGQGT